MNLQDLYNLIISSVPAITAIVTVLVMTVKVVASILEVKNAVKDDSTNTKELIHELKIENQTLREAQKESNRQIKELTKSVQKVVDKVETDV